MAGKYDFTIEQGATFRRVLTWKDASQTAVDLTGRTARMKIRNRTGTIIKSLTNGSGLTLGGSAGTIAIDLTAAETSALYFDSGRYDLEIVTPGTGGAPDSVKRLLQGTVILDPEETT